jgi:cytochrome c553
MTKIRSVVVLVLGFAISAAAWAQPATSKPSAADDLRATFATPQDVAEGKRLAQESCARCHGANGVSAAAGIPHIAGQRAAYLHQQLRAYRQGGRPQSAMTGAVGFLSEDGLIKVAAYYASLDPPPRVATKAPPARPDPVQAGKSAAAACSGCHGEGGVTAIPGTPSLVGLDPAYFAAAMAGYRTGARKNDLMKGFAAGLSDAEFNNLGLYYATQKPAKAKTKAAGDAAAGKAAAAVCGGCHGETGVSASAATPSIAGQDADYLVAATKAYKEGARKSEPMKGPAEAIDDKALRDVAAFYAAQAPQPPAVRKPLALDEWVARCDRCHGVNGNSTDPVVPAIASQRADWLESVLHAYRNGARKSTAMSAMSATLSETDVKDLAAYYSRQAARPVTYVQIPAK